MVWSKFTSSDATDDGSGIIAGRYSDDGGRTWSARDQVIVDNEGRTNVMSLSLGVRHQRG
jgi:hypothetical protein